jgi:hypothetical protein
VSSSFFLATYASKVTASKPNAVSKSGSYCTGRVLSMTETERLLTPTEQTTENVPTSVAANRPFGPCQ